MRQDDGFFYHIHLRRTAAAAVDFSIEGVAALLGAYFGAVLAALMVVIHAPSPQVTQGALGAGMLFGASFCFLIASWVNRVLIQGMTRASIGKKLMKLEIVSVGDPISWPVMMKHWVTMTIATKVKVVEMGEEAHKKTRPESDTAERLKAA